MKRFVVQTVLFLLSIAVVLLVTELLARSIPNSYRYKALFMEYHADSVELIVLGSSHAFCHIDPARLTPYSVNLANSAQPLRYDRFLLEKYIRTTPKLKYVLLPVSYFTLFSDTSANIGVRRDMYYAREMGFPYSALPKYHLEVWDPAIALYKIKTYYVSHAPYKEHMSNPDGFCPLSPERKRAAGVDWNNGPKSARGYTVENRKNMAHLSACTAVIDRMADLCASRNVRLVLFTPPSTAAFYTSLDPAVTDTIHQTLRGILHRHPGVLYWDFLRDPDFSDADFIDGDHLLSAGAEKLTAKMDSLLKMLSAPKK